MTKTLRWGQFSKHTDIDFPIPFSRRNKLLIRIRKLRKLSVESCTSYQKSLDVSQHFFSTLHAAARLHGIGPGLRCIMRLGYQLGSWIRLLCVGSPAEYWVLCCRSYLSSSGHLMGVWLQWYFSWHLSRFYCVVVYQSRSEQMLN